MENYPMFFLGSSTTMITPSPSSLPSNVTNSHHAFNINDFYHNNQNDFSGLKRDQIHVPTSESAKNVNSSNNIVVPENEVQGAGKIKKGGLKKVRKHRFAFQTRSQVDILDDGYRWRKYGQKAVKDNKFPRSYYRCSHQGCNVKKQVQRLSKDEGIVVTTYEGMHTHSQKHTDNFNHILNQMDISPAF